jgi:hypothetical protein
MANYVFSMSSDAPELPKGYEVEDLLFSYPPGHDELSDVGSEDEEEVDDDQGEQDAEMELDDLIHRSSPPPVPGQRGADGQRVPRHRQMNRFDKLKAEGIIMYHRFIGTKTNMTMVRGLNSRYNN